MKPPVTWGFSGIIAGFLVPVSIFLSGHHQAAHSPAGGHTAPRIHLETQHVSIPGRYRVQLGDTLSSIARRYYGHADRWPALWFTNRRRVANPNSITVGQQLTLARWHPDDPALLAKALRHVPAPPPPRRAVLASSPAGAADPAPAASVAQPAQPAAPQQPAASYSGGSSFQQCVIQAESGGNPSAVNASSGAGGLYGFLPSTWQGLGFSGLPENAPVSEQNAAFAKEYAQSGTSAWSAYDGC